MGRVIKEFDSDGTFLASYKTVKAAARANYITDFTVHKSIETGAVIQKVGKYFTVEYVEDKRKGKKKNNCPACYYGRWMGTGWSCMYYYMNGVGHRRPCKIEDCEIWRTSPKGGTPLKFGKEKPKNVLSKAQANHLTAILMGDDFVPENKRVPVCPACSKELDRDAVFCKYCGAKV